MADARGSALRLSQWLILVGATLLLLPLAHTLYLNHSYINEVEEQDRAAVSRRLTITAERIHDTIGDIQIILQTMAQAEPAIKGDWRLFHEYAQRIAQDNRVIDAITLIDSQERLVFGTAVPYGSEHPVAARPEDARRVFETGMPVLSGPFQTPFSNAESKSAWLVALGVPVIRQGKVTHVLRGIITCDTLQEILSDLALPEGWQAAITDREGTHIARSFRHDETVGLPVVAPLMEALRNHRSGLFSIVTREGITLMTQIANVPHWDWFVLVGVSNATLASRAQGLLWQLGGVQAFITLLLIILGGWAIRRLALSMQSISANTHAASRGQTINPKATGIRELDTMQDQLAQLALTQWQMVEDARSQSSLIEKIAHSLAESESRLQRAQSAAHVGIWEWDVLTGQNHWSDETFRLFGYAPGAVNPSYKTWLDAILPEDRAITMAMLDECIKTEQEVQLQWRRAAADGEIRWLMSRGQPECGAGGTVERYRGIVMDITEQHQLEERSRMQLEEMARLQRLHTADEMAGMLAHELNQPLATIATYAVVCRQILAHDSPDQAKLKHVIENINQQSLRAGEIIKHLRRFVSRSSIETEPHDINALIRGTLELMMPNARRKYIRLDMNLAPELPPVQIAAVQIEQVLLNLLRNAFDALAGQNGGTVTLSSRLDDGAVRVTVADTGPGIPAEQAEVLFASMASAKPAGLGMGLRISRNLVEVHGGKLWVEPHAPGAIFHFTLPVAV